MPQFLPHEALTDGDPNFPIATGNPIGTIIQSILTQAQINTQQAGTWQLCNGAATTAGSSLLALGITNVPDTQGRFLAGVGSVDGTPAKVLNTPLASALNGGDITVNDPGHTHVQRASAFIGGETTPIASGSLSGLGAPDNFNNTGSSTTGITISAGTGDETRPATYVVNMFIKIN